VLQARARLAILLMAAALWLHISRHPTGPDLGICLRLTGVIM
jgi:hypothetical protein